MLEIKIEFVTNSFIKNLFELTKRADNQFYALNDIQTRKFRNHRRRTVLTYFRDFKSFPPHGASKGSNLSAKNESNHKEDVTARRRKKTFN